MKIVALCLLLISSLYAEPKIALVLSGGGARGGAHVGVLKVLQEHRVPVHMVVGTSMGSFVGGLYASGQTPQEIENMLTSTNWREYIRTSYDRVDIPMRRKNIDYTYPGRLGFGVNQENEFVLPTGVFKRQPMLLEFINLTQDVHTIKDFDNLSIPFRAVATDVKNGESVVLKSGSLGEAIYASSSIPGGFQPIKINGIDLIDGGISDNVPVQVARDMGADILIVVDVSEDFNQELNVNSYFVVMGQLVDILMRKNANESIETLSEKDVLIIPDLEGFSGLDADKYSEIIQRGATLDAKNLQKLHGLSLSEAEYEEYRKKYRKRSNYSAPIIEKIKIINPTYLSDETIKKSIRQKEGEALKLPELREDLMSLYNMMIFDSVEYDIVEINAQTTLLIKTKPSWDNHGEIRFSFGIEDDFDGHSAYSLKIGYTMFGINSYAAEWRNDLEIGKSKKFLSEYYQPLDTSLNYYIRPAVTYEAVTDIFTLEGFKNQELFTSRYGGGFAFGRNIQRDIQLEVGLFAYKDLVEIASLNLSNNYDARPFYASVKYDNLDNAYFPKNGLKSELVWTKELSEIGSDYSYEQVYMDIEKPFVFGAHNITAYLEFASTYKDDDVERFFGTHNLGGLFNLSGYTPYTFNDQNLVLGVMKYTYEIKDGGFFGSFNAPLYAGFSAEVGETWGRENSLNAKNLKQSGSVFLAADTFLGPFYLAYGFAADGENSFYLYLGEKF